MLSRAARLLHLGIALFFLTASRRSGAASSTPSPTKLVGEPSLYVEIDKACKQGAPEYESVVTLRKNQSALLQEMFRAPDATEFELYKGCQALTPGHENSCDVFEGVNSGLFEKSKFICGDISNFARMVWNIFNQQSAIAACQLYVAGDPERKKDIPVVCRALIAALRNERAGHVCAGINSSLRVAGSNLQANSECEPFFEGIPTFCANNPQGPNPLLCQELSKFLSAVRSKDSRACTSSPLCNAMATRNVGACSPLLLRANKDLCARVTGSAGLAAQSIQPVKELERRTRMDIEKKRREGAAMRKPAANKSPGRTYKSHERMQSIPPDVLRQMKKLEKKAQGDGAQTTIPSSR
jgi:hypothetical protein